MTGLVDIGLNLTHDSFSADREAVLTRAADAGVEICIVTGASIESSRAAIALATAHPGRLYATAGVHPHHAESLDSAGVAELRTLLDAQGIVAAGECGLDFFRNFASAAAQEWAFAAQLDLAVEKRRPVFLHQRDAHQRFVEMVAARRSELCGGVAHCFTGGQEELAAYLDLDLYVGITGWVCDPERGDALRQAVPRIPLDRLLIETDAPYLLPKDLADKPRNRRNEPCFLPHVLARIAELREETVLEIAQATRRNSAALFSLPPA
jgi:TatD DNase family protein